MLIRRKLDHSHNFQTNHLLLFQFKFNQNKKNGLGKL